MAENRENLETRSGETDGNELNVTQTAGSRGHETEKTDLDVVLELVDKGVENLSPEQLHAVYLFLKQYSGTNTPGGEAFNKVSQYADKKLQDMEKVPEEERTSLEALAAIKREDKAAEENVVRTNEAGGQDGDAEVSAPDGQPRAVGERKDEAQTENGSINYQANLEAVDKVLESLGNMETAEDGSLSFPEYLSGSEFNNFNKFFAEMDFDGSTPDGTVSKDDLKREMLELAILEAQAELIANPNFATLDPEEQARLLRQVVADHADQVAMAVIQAQISRNFEEENAGLLKKHEEDSKSLNVEERKKILDLRKNLVSANKGYASGNLGSMKINADVATGAVIASSFDLLKRAQALESRTGFSGLKDRVAAFDKRMKTKHPKVYAAAKKALVSGLVGYTTGGVGLAVLAGYRSYQVIRKSYQTYKQNGGEGGYLKYLRNNPKEIISIGTSVALTTVSAAFAGVDVAQQGLDAAGMLGKMFNAQDLTQVVSNKVLKAGMRAGVSVSSGLANAMMDFRAVRNETDPAKRKQLYKNAWKTAGLSVAAGLGGVALAEYSSDFVSKVRGWFGKNDQGVDAVTGAAVRVQGNDGAVFGSDMSELDDRLLKLGVNPDVYRNMSPEAKMMMIRQREMEFGMDTPEKAAVQPNLGNEELTETQMKRILTRNAERHPGVDMDKVYNQLRAAGINNPEQAFYKLEQARLLAPNDEIMSADGTNVRDTFNRALKGEQLTAADMKILGAAQANVDNGGFYLHDVRDQGGVGYSYRPNGQPSEYENTEETGHGGRREQRTATPGRSGDQDFAGAEMLDVSKMSPADRALYEQMMAQYKLSGDKNWQGSANTAYSSYQKLMSAGKVDEAREFAKGFSREETLGEYDNRYGIEEGDSRRLISAKRDAARAEIQYNQAVERLRESELALKNVQHLDKSDPERLAAELKHAQNMKAEVAAQIKLSKATVELNRAQLSNDLHHAGDDLKDAEDALKRRDKMENRIQTIDKKLTKLGIDQNNAPKMTGDYGTDKELARDYLKTAIANKKDYAEITKLLKEKQELRQEIAAQGPRKLLEKTRDDAQAKVDELKGKRPEVREVKKDDVYEEIEHPRLPDRQVEVPLPHAESDMIEVQNKLKVARSLAEKDTSATQLQNEAEAILKGGGKAADLEQVGDVKFKQLGEEGFIAYIEKDGQMKYSLSGLSEEGKAEFMAKIKANGSFAKTVGSLDGQSREIPSRTGGSRALPVNRGKEK